MLFGGETAQSYFEEGLTAAMKGDLEKAIGYFRRAYELDCSLHNAQHQIGRCLLRQGNAEAALPLLRSAAQKMPVSTSPLLDTGFALLQLRHIDEARKTFASLLQTRPDEPRAVMGLAYCAFARGQWETATNLVQRSIEMGRVQFDTHFLLARAADKSDLIDVSTSHYKKAEELINKTIEATPDQAAGYYLRGHVYWGLGQLGAALDDMENAEKHMQPGRRYYAYNESFSSEDICAAKESLRSALTPPPPKG
ncbi:MAG TPA: tetratricopeptide repeat protein [Candidatus Hydrogenedentes bacterium]|nr:tetratricopeptide repeat protein [Candidatus Hydrogenedentota bacterium]